VSRPPSPRPAFARRPLPSRRVPRRRYFVSFSAAALTFIVALATAWPLAALKPGVRSGPEYASSEPSTLAALPFTVSARDQEYFSEGLAEDFAAALSRYDGLAVTSRNASLRPGTSEEDLANTGRMLGARDVLAGSARRGATSVHVTATLVDTATGAQAATERIDRPPSELLAARAAIVAGIAERLLGNTDRARVRENRPAPPITPDAYDRFLLARLPPARRPGAYRRGASQGGVARVSVAGRPRDK
jgi:TolB-like protein